MSPDDTSLVPLAWHHARFVVPRTWELIRFKKNPDDGQLVLSDRHGETMHLFWRRLRERPSVDRRLVELVRQNVSAELDESAIRNRVRRLHGWESYLPEDRNGHWLAARWLENRVFLVLAFPPHPHGDQKTIEQVLASFGPNDGDDVFWAALGMEVRLPADLGLAHVDAKPAAQRLVFENRRHESVTVHRYGMLSLLLAEDDLATFFARIKSRRLLLRREGEFRKDGRHEGAIVSYTTRGSGQSPFATLLARTWHGRAWVWRRDDIERLFCVEQHARRADFVEDLPDRLRVP